MTNEAFATYTDKSTGLEFRWHGGEYIDIGYTQAQGVAGIDGDDFHAYDCINVWNYAEGRATIDFSQFEDACREWLDDRRTGQW